MATARIKDKISQLVRGQLPEFIRTDYNTFVTFIEYYYKFLEQDQGALELVQNAQSYSDIDQTAASFVNYFLKNYASDIPVDILANKPLLIKNISDLYASKGSDLSFQTLFRLLYNTTAKTRHPYDYVLRPSDGRWDISTSLRVEKTYGSVSDIVDRYLTLTKNGINYTVEVVRVKTLTTNLYEIYYKTHLVVPFEIDDTVSISNATSVIFTGTIKPTTTSYLISTKGSGFRAGQVFNIASGGAFPTLARITGVDKNGGITSIKFLNYGYNYTSNITLILSNDLSVTPLTRTFGTLTNGFKETFQAILKHTSGDSGRYFDTDYVSDLSYTGTVLASSTFDGSSSQSDTVSSLDVNSAIISFNLGAIANYPGQYISTQGFLSEPDVRLQDSKLYQPFAYQVESELDISVFYDTVKNLIHPAGTNLFVNRLLTTTANIKANVHVETRKNVFAEFHEAISIAETAIIKNLGKFITDVTNVPSESIASIDVYKVLSDSEIPLDANISYNLSKVLEDSVLQTESLTYNLNIVLNDTTPVNDELLNVGKIYLRTFANSTTLSDVTNLNINSVQTDLASITDTALVVLQLQPFSDITASQDTTFITFNTAVVDDITIAEAFNLSVEKNINNTDSIVTLTESGSAVLLDYAESGYFAEIYAGTTTPIV